MTCLSAATIELICMRQLTLGGSRKENESVYSLEVQSDPLCKGDLYRMLGEVVLCMGKAVFVSAVLKDGERLYP
jgi:hypothetical protein